MQIDTQNSHVYLNISGDLFCANAEGAGIACVLDGLKGRNEWKTTFYLISYTKPFFW